MKKTLCLILLSMIPYSLEAKDNTRLQVTNNPRVGIANPSKPATWTVKAEIKGPESEQYYCPKVRWILGDGIDRIVAEQESDCPAYEERHSIINSPECRPMIKNHDLVYPDCYKTESFGYPRVWSRRYGTYSPGKYQVCVQLVKNDKVFASQCSVFISAGDN